MSQARPLAMLASGVSLSSALGQLSMLLVGGSPGLLGGIREVGSLCGWHMRQPGVTYSHLLSTYCVPGFQTECDRRCGPFMSTASTVCCPRLTIDLRQPQEGVPPSISYHIMPQILSCNSLARCVGRAGHTADAGKPRLPLLFRAVTALGDES